MTTLLYSGNIGLGQDLDSVLKAAAQISSVEKLQIFIVGEGKCLSKYWELVSKLGLTNVSFRPPVPLLQLPTLLAEGDIHIVCQKPGTEGLLVPSKIYSTLAAGRPAIFIGPVDCEVSWILRDSESGFVVTPGDVEGVKEALSKLVTLPELRRSMGEKARGYYESHFGRDKSLSQIVEILEKSCSSNDNGRNRGRDTRLQSVDSFGESGKPLTHPANSTIRAFFPKRLVTALGSMIVHAFKMR